MVKKEGRPWVYVKLPYLYDIYVVILENIVWYFLDALEAFESYQALPRILSR